MRVLDTAVGLDDPLAGSLHQGAIVRVLSAMRAQTDEPLPLRTMAEIAGLSLFHFARVFRHATGSPPGEFLTALRLERAKQLLLTTDLSVTEICFEVGYTSLGTFTTRFAQLVGLPPSQLRRLPELAGPALARIAQGEEIAPRPRLAPVQRSVVGWVNATDVTDALIFVGLFPVAIPQRRPVAGTILRAPGPYRLAMPPPGSYHLLAAALPISPDPLAALLPGAAVRVGRGTRPLVVRDGQARGPRNVTLRPRQTTDPPILVALPALLLDRLSPLGMSQGRKIEEARSG